MKDYYSVKFYNEICSSLINNIPLRQYSLNNTNYYAYHNKKIFLSQLDNITQRKLWFYSRLKKTTERAIKNKLIFDTIIHGSYGDDTYTFYSDIELTILLNEKIFIDDDKKRLFSLWIKNEMLPLVYRIDPLQHHGFFFLWNELINNYNESIIPVCAYEKSWSLFSKTICLRTTETTIKKTNRINLKLTIQKLCESQKYFFKFGYTPYAIKRYISNFFMLPVYYYQQNGLLITKREALKKIQQSNLLKMSDAIYAASKMRDSWPMPPKWLGIVRGEIRKMSIVNISKLDLALVSIYRDKLLKREFQKFVFSKIIEGCHELKDEL